MQKSGVSNLVKQLIFVTFALSTCCRAANTMSLAGKWRFAADPQDLGIQEHWSNRTFSGSITLPGSTDEAGIGKPGPVRIGVLTRKHEYIGPAWYQRDINIPPEWNDMNVELFLERVLWQTQLWVDGKDTGATLDSWAAPHVHRLGRLAPGRHTITLRIDNRMIHPLGTMSSSYGPQTQTRWNGVIGRIELRAQPKYYIEQVRIFTPRRNNSWSVDVQVKATPGAHVTVRLIDPASDTTPGTPAGAVVPANGMIKLHLVPDTKPVAWSEFTPRLYEIVVELRTEGKLVQTLREKFGFREIRHEGNKLLLNGIPIFMRGNLDCVHFPLTGYPSTNKQDWLDIFRKYKQHNLNHVRFHTWCPPEAAFAAADELGIYIQASAGIWINENTAGGEGLGPGKNDRTVDSFTQAEMRRVVDTFGNHPSFVLFVIGNELGHSNFKVTGQWIKHLKEYDPRRLYAASTARTITPYCDFNATHAVPGIGWVRQHMEAGTNWDYENKYSRTQVPIIAHEIGQWPVYPHWSLIDKFTGVLRNIRLEQMRRQSREAGVFAQQADFTSASGALNALIYKDEIESFLRTPSCRGFQLLSMEDFQGQGEAYVGWLDMFWDSKGTTDPRAFRGYCAPVSVLAKLPRYIFKADDNLDTTILLRNDGPVPLRNKLITCLVRTTGGDILYRQKLQAGFAARGTLIEAGKLHLSWANLPRLDRSAAQRLTLELHLADKPEANSYPLWVYPTELPPVDTTGVIMAQYPDKKILAALNGGAIVFLDAHTLGEPEWQKKLAAWKPLYWSLVYFRGQAETLGLLVRDKHPAFRYFPTEHFNNWQWWGICSGGHGFDLTRLVPSAYRPIAQPVPDFHANRKLGTIFEFKVGRGKVLVCGYNLSAKRCRQNPAVRQLRYSLMRYITSSVFNPVLSITPAALEKLLPIVRVAQPVTPPGFTGAMFYLDTAGKYGKLNQQVAYSPGLDKVVTARNITYDVKGIDVVWRDNYCSAWIINKTRPAILTLHTPDAIQGELFVHFSDWNRNSRRGSIILEGGRTRLTLARHDQSKQGIWLKMDVIREDTLDGKLTVEFRCTGGSNLMITDVAFVPRD